MCLSNYFFTPHILSISSFLMLSILLIQLYYASYPSPLLFLLAYINLDTPQLGQVILYANFLHTRRLICVSSHQKLSVHPQYYLPCMTLFSTLAYPLRNLLNFTRKYLNSSTPSSSSPCRLILHCDLPFLVKNSVLFSFSFHFQHPPRTFIAEPAQHSTQLFLWFR